MLLAAMRSFLGLSPARRTPLALNMHGRADGPAVAKTERSIRMFLSLAFLDPTLVKFAAEGRLPRGYGLSRLTDLPMAWPAQWQALGLPQPA